MRERNFWGVWVVRKLGVGGEENLVEAAIRGTFTAMRRFQR